jgi:hypothetical protein
MLIKKFSTSVRYVQFVESFNWIGVYLILGKIIFDAITDLSHFMQILGPFFYS